MTNNALAQAGGSETYLRDLALGLVRRGHFPIVYSPILGEVAEELERATVPVINDLRALNAAPDLIHGHHHLETMAAAMMFRETPAVYVCHGWMPWEEEPPAFPTIMRHVAVSDLLRERLLTRPGIAAERVVTIYSFVDTDRFVPTRPLPDRPRTALFFSNTARDDERTAVIRSACLSAGIARLDLLGRDSGMPVNRPETILPNYDIVFALGRSALEAIACGCAVIVADADGMAGLATTGTIDHFHALNCGARALQSHKTSEETVRSAIARFDRDDARRVTDWVRSHAGLDRALDAWLTVYDDALVEWRDPDLRASATDPGRQGAAAARYLATLALLVKGRHSADSERLRIQGHLSWSQSESARLQSELERLLFDLTRTQSLLSAEQAEMAACRVALSAKQTDLLDGNARSERLTAQVKELEAIRDRASDTEVRLQCAESRLSGILNSRAWAFAIQIGSLKRMLIGPRSPR